MSAAFFSSRAKQGAKTVLQTGTFHQRLIAALALAVASDWLFYDEPPGISAAVFALLMAGIITWLWGNRRTPTEIFRAWIILILSLLPLSLQTTSVALLFAAAGLITFSLLMTGSVSSPARISLFHIPAHLWHSPFFLLRDLHRHGAGRKSMKALRSLSMLITTAALSAISALIHHGGRILLPLILAWLFIKLFSFANPLFAAILPTLRLELDLERYFDTFFSHALLMALTVLVVWGLLRRNAIFRLKAMKRAKAGVGAGRSIVRSFLPGPFPDTLLTLTLLVFNAIFAVHVITDLYLELPAHLDPKEFPSFRYAEYAHDGAYALAVAAALAGVFVLIAFPSAPYATKPSVWVLRLLYLWLAQTLAIALSALVRLNLYVSAYSLTHARIYGFVFIALVCLGIVLVAWRVHAGRSTRWLIRTSMLAVIAAVWSLSVINLDNMIARYNIAHSREVTGRGLPLDVRYITKNLSVYALPAMFAENGPWRNDPVRMAYAASRIREALSYYKGWRQWSWRAWQLRAFERALREACREIMQQRRSKRHGG